MRCARCERAPDIYTNFIQFGVRRRLLQTKRSDTEVMGSNKKGNNRIRRTVTCCMNRILFLTTSHLMRCKSLACVPDERENENALRPFYDY